MMDIYLKQAIEHVIDRNFGDPIYSQVGLDLNNINIREYLSKKIQKISSAQTKTGTLKQDSTMAQLVAQVTDNFTDTSSKIVRHWYETYVQSEDAPGADAFVVLFEKDTEMYVAFLKVNYHEAFTHLVGDADGKIANDLIIHQSILAGKTQRPDEGFTVKISDNTYELIEKKYTFSGEKMEYLSNRVIESEPVASLDDNVKTVKKVAEKVAKSFDIPKFDVVNNVKDAIHETIASDGEIDTQQVAQTVFNDNISAKAEFESAIHEKLPDSKIPVTKEVQEIAIKKYGKQKLKLSNGIEMTIPLDVYQDPNLIEFVNNPDGTISVTIKNVEEVISRL